VINFTRKVGETINIGDAIELRVTRIEDGVVRIALDAPKEILIFRGELYREIHKQREADSSGSSPLPE